MAGWREAQLTLSLCVQDAEQSFLSELAALARVPLAESKPSSSKRGPSGTWWEVGGHGGGLPGLGMGAPVPCLPLASSVALGTVLTLAGLLGPYLSRSSLRGTPWGPLLALHQ